MMANPKRGQTVEVRYAKAKLQRAAEIYPLQGSRGTVEIVGKGKPRNHGVRIDGSIVVVPCGNLFKR